MRTFKASGKGGQHRNKVESAVELTHKPTGIKAKCASERKQSENKRIAFELLTKRVQEKTSREQSANRSNIRKDQIGSGLRGEKIQTVQEQNGQVVSHVTGIKIPLKIYLKGNITRLH